MSASFQTHTIKHTEFFLYFFQNQKEELNFWNLKLISHFPNPALLVCWPSQGDNRSISEEISLKTDQNLITMSREKCMFKSMGILKGAALSKHLLGLSPHSYSVNWDKSFSVLCAKLPTYQVPRRHNSADNASIYSSFTQKIVHFAVVFFSIQMTFT